MLSPAAVSSGFLSACISRGIPVLFFVGRGRAYGSLVAGGMPNPIRLRAQYPTCWPGQNAVWVWHGRSWMRIFGAMLARLSAAAAESRSEVETLRARLSEAPDIPTLMGLEGAATKAYYQGFAARIRRPEFALTERPSARPVTPSTACSRLVLR